MRTLKEKLAEIEAKAKKIEYELSDGCVFTIRHNNITKKWGINCRYPEEHYTIAWPNDETFKTVDAVVDYIFNYEMGCIKSYIEYLEEFSPDDIVVKIDPDYVRNTVIDKLNVVEWR